MKYRITLLNSNDYCKLKPDDITCQYSVKVVATDKYQAVWQYLLDRRQDMRLNLQERSATQVPEVWSVEVIK